MFEKIVEAANRLDGIAHKTPVLTSTLLDELTENHIFLKCENFQRMGAFKFRGAYNAISMLSKASRNKGVIAFSSGNHAMATALACNILHIPATVVMPADAPQVKAAAVQDYGASIITYNRLRESREQIAQELMDEFGYTLIPPFDAEPIIFGQGTVAKEFIEEVGELDYLLVPCGGGGLLSGCAISAKYLLPDCRVIGVEPAIADDATKSFKTGALQVNKTPNSIADGLNTTSLGKITFPIINNYVDDFVTVSEEEIKAAMYFLWTRLKIVVEPSGAVALAAYQKLSVKGKRIGVVASGGNVDVKTIGNLFLGI
ncbi:threo-3-hydroxy-L-aspartate ammonia-lyase [Oceanobacillus sp. J11TS1]|uniref:threo-3-hydroxy-L-aspartate ammonia-lyase n=1 Tax=Oceanobacillus sp. J11TS1 TaxID=2807191 RepID=UPI001B177A3F|nr:threo-3-hydroxy-L-aspartate ammonia-lyase [Oceanobacillus sp. J11TS1]GIO22712.1 serine/threonine dehydratase [Oceanobacillus sp. J11TS1]